MATDPFLTIVLRSYNEAWALRDTLPALRQQDYRNWELIVFDSGSTDGSVELIQAAQPAHFIQLLPHEYNPSRVMNHGMALARSDRVIFLNADATPQGAGWLRTLAAPLADPETAAVFGRQLARPGCAAVFAHDYERCFGANRESAQWEHFFSMVSSGLRKDIWARRGFLETMQYSEDDEYTRWCRAQGYQVVYCPEAVVLHSHNYTPRQAYKRSFGEAWALAAVWDKDPAPMTDSTRSWSGWARDVHRDLAFCRGTGRLREWPEAARIRWQQRQGRRAGFKAGWAMHRQLPDAERNHHFSPRRDARFTVDGSAALEEHLADSCAAIAAGVRGLIPAERLEAVVLGGGYGRGEGGVLPTATGDRPYNDLEFYVCLRGNRHLNELRYGHALHVLGEILTPQVGVEVEFKITSRAAITSGSLSMYAYDLIAGHRVIAGDPELLAHEAHVVDPSDIPLAEATRLLMNRCSGLLFAQDELAAQPFTSAAADFVQRNIAKAALALGDAVLVAFGHYHWSARERHRQIARLTRTESLPWLEEVCRQHAFGVAFKLHPFRATAPHGELAEQHRRVTALAREVWLWLEARRLHTRFASIRDYLASHIDKWPDTSPLRNLLIGLRIYGPAVRFDRDLGRHPRSRILDALATSLWEPAALRSPEMKSRLQYDLHTHATSFHDLVAAYRNIWRRVT